MYKPTPGSKAGSKSPCPKPRMLAVTEVPKAADAGRSTTLGAGLAISARLRALRRSVISAVTPGVEIGRAAGRGRGEISGGARSFKKKKKEKKNRCTRLKQKISTKREIDCE